MLTISRLQARRLHALFRRSCLGLPPRGPVPPVVFSSDPDGSLHARIQTTPLLLDRVVGPADDVVDPCSIPLDALGVVEGREETAVAFEPAGGDRIRVRWHDRGIPQSRDWAGSSEPHAAIPGLPDVWHTMRGAFWSALAEASATTSDDTARFALDCVQLRGGRGEVVATDGRQLLIGRGWPQPWDGDLLIPGSPIFGRPEWSADRPISLGRTATHVVLRSGPGTLFLPIRAEARYPDVTRILEGDGSSSTELRLDPADAAFLRPALGRLPGSGRMDAPVTLDLDGRVAVRALQDGDEATELVLARSTCSGPAIRVAMNREYLARALTLGLTRFMATRPDAPVVATDLVRTYAWQPLPVDVAIGSTGHTTRVDSSTHPEPINHATRVSIPVPDCPTPPTQAAPDDDSSSSNTLVSLIRDAESIHATLGDLKLRSARLTAALRRHRKRSRLMESTLRTLRQLRLQDVS